EEFGAPPTAADSVNRPVLQQTLRLAVAILQTRYGNAPSRWRWERVQPGTRSFPVWSRGGAPGGPAAARYAPITEGFGGHPTALHLGPSLVFEGWPTPSVWTAWTTTDDWGDLLVRHPTGRADAALATREPAAPRRFRADAALTDPLTLRPRGR